MMIREGRTMWIKNRKPEESDRGTKRSSLWKRYLIVMLAVLMLVVTGIAYNAARRTGDPVKNVREAEKEPIELFVLAPCESCHEEEKFRARIATVLPKRGLKIRIIPFITSIKKVVHPILKKRLENMDLGSH